ncbi:MAG TPA: oligosaccharide flippase family protein [Thermoplasmata archaeon]|nr:oligosaccharide flippase family protein [Thermoplasmata archaeon]
MARDISAAREGLHSVTRGTLILLLGTVAFVGASFIARVLLVRYLSSIEFSEFYIALTLAGLLTALGQLGLPNAVARSIPFAHSPEERRAFIRTGFFVVVPLALGAGAVLFGLSIPISDRFHAPLLGMALQFFAVAVVCAIVTSQVASVFQGFEDVWPNTLFVQILNPVLFIAFVVAFVAVGPRNVPFGYSGALFAYALSAVVALGGILVYYRARIGRYLTPGPVAPGAARRLMLFAAPLFVVGIFSYLAGSVDTLLLGYFHNSQTGAYGAALSLSRLTLLGLGALAYILLPVIARFARDNDPENARLIYATATKWMVVTSLPVWLVFVFFPGPSLTFVYKSSYAQSTLPLQILVTGAFASTVIGPASAAQVSFGQTRLLLYNNIAGAAFDVILGLLLVPTYGEVGAAVAWAGAATLIPTLSVAELAWTHGLHPFLRNYLVGLLGTSIPIAVIFALVPGSPPLWLLPGLVLGVAATFLGVVIATRSFDRGDRLLLEAVERMIGRPLPGARWIARHFPARD